MRDSADGFVFVVKCWCPVNTAQKKPNRRMTVCIQQTFAFKTLVAAKLRPISRVATSVPRFPAFSDWLLTVIGNEKDADVHKAHRRNNRIKELKFGEQIVDRRRRKGH